MNKRFASIAFALPLTAAAGLGEMVGEMGTEGLLVNPSVPITTQGDRHEMLKRPAQALFPRPDCVR